MPTLDPNGDYLTSVWRNHVYPLAARLKMPLRRPPLQPRSRLAHEAAKWADAQGEFGKYNIALFRAFFEYGKDIGDLEILQELATEIKLDAQKLAISLKNGEYTSAVLAEEDEAQRIGVRAVPAFTAHGQLLAAGVQTAERLYEMLSEKSINLP